MTFTVNKGTQERMTKYLEDVGEVLGNKKRRESFAIYAMGLFGDSERKSVEPIAARASCDPKETDDLHQRLTYFLSESDWSDAPIRRFCAKYALEKMTKREAVECLIVDDTGFLKQGAHSVGVKRQYTGSAGKIANCQIGVSLSLSTRSEHVPIDFELYLPKDWTDDKTRRDEGHIPKEIDFKTKPELALQMIRRAVADDMPPGVVLADSAYGDNGDFRRGIREEGLPYAIEVHSPTTVWRLDKEGQRVGEPMSVADVGHHMKGPCRKVTWREGCKGKMRSRFARCRVRPVHCVPGGSDDEEIWLLMECPEGEICATKFWLASLPKSMTCKELVRLVKERYRTERVYEDMKGELGLDHFEGRSYRGWHHHVTVALACFAFIIAERVQRFPPRYSKRPTNHPLARKTRTSLPRIVHHRAPGLCPHHRFLATKMPIMPSLE